MKKRKLVVPMEISSAVSSQKISMKLMCAVLQDSHEWRRVSLGGYGKSRMSQVPS
jgi:hypothetical protein